MNQSQISQNAWKEVNQRLKKELSPHIYEAWFASVKCKEGSKKIRYTYGYKASLL